MYTSMCLWWHNIYIKPFLCVRLPLEAKKRKIERNLKILVEAELVSEKDNYQTMVNAIAQVRYLFIYLFIYLFKYSH